VALNNDRIESAAAAANHSVICASVIAVLWMRQCDLNRSNTTVRRNDICHTERSASASMSVHNKVW